MYLKQYLMFSRSLKIKTYVLLHIIQNMQMTKLNRRTLNKDRTKDHHVPSFSKWLLCYSWLLFPGAKLFTRKANISQLQSKTVSLHSNGSFPSTSVSRKYDVVPPPHFASTARVACLRVFQTHLAAIRSVHFSVSMPSRHRYRWASRQAWNEPCFDRPVNMLSCSHAAT